MYLYGKGSGGKANFGAGRFFASRRRLERYCEEVQYNQSPQAAYSEIVL